MTQGKVEVSFMSRRPRRAPRPTSVTELVPRPRRHPRSLHWRGRPATPRPNAVGRASLRSEASACGRSRSAIKSDTASAEMAERGMTRGMKMTARTVVMALVAIGLGFAIVAPANASMQIEAFTTTASSNQAGGHPDLTTSFDLVEPGIAESPKNVIFNAPEGIFGTPSALLKCTSKQFALTECGPSSQAGYITIRANFSGNP